MNKNKGFTLIELLVAVAIFSILASLAAPALKNFSANNRRTAQLNHFIGTMAIARNEAVKNGQAISLCSSNDRATCTGTSWEAGWILFSDLNGNGNLDVADDALMKVYEPLRGANISLADIDAARTSITYNATGFSSSRATFMRCDDRPTAALRDSNARAVIISATGNVSTSKVDDNNGDAALVCP